MGATVVGQSGEEVRGVVRRHLLEEFAGLLVGHVDKQRRLEGRVHLLEGVGGDLIVEGVEDSGALVRRELVDEVGDVGGVKELELGARHGEADPALVGLREVDLAPVDQARAGLLSSHAQTLAHAAEADAPQDRAARHVDGGYAHVLPRTDELDVVDADDLAALGVDELLVEEGRGEQALVGLKLALGQRVAGDAQQGA